MTLEEYLNIHDQVLIKRCGSLGTTGYTVTSANGIQITIGHEPTALKNIERALDLLSKAVDEKSRKDIAALEAARLARIRRVIKF